MPKQRMGPGTGVLCLELSMASAYARDVMQGVRRCVGNTGPWQILVREPNLGTVEFLDGPGRGLVTGVIGHWASAALEQEHARLNLPAVNVSGARPDSLFPRVLPDNREAGRLAARHLVNCGLRRLAFFGEGRRVFSDERYAGFAEEAKRAGCICERCRSERDRRDAELRRLEKPTGVAVATDGLAGKLIYSACAQKILVPEELAIIGITNDETQCEMCDVALSSVDLDADRVGYEAARLLIDIIAGKAPPEQPLAVRPRGVVGRASTDVVASDDPLVREAVSCMRRHACDPISVKEVVRRIGGSRRTLEERFRRSLGRSPHQEIRRLQMARACELLRDTDIKVPDVAWRVGYPDPKRFAGIFGQTLGLSPTAYRRQYRTV